MKNRKRVLSIVICFVLALSLLPSRALAEEVSPVAVFEEETEETVFEAVWAEAPVPEELTEEQDQGEALIPEKPTEETDELAFEESDSPEAIVAEAEEEESSHEVSAETEEELELAADEIIDSGYCGDNLQ